MADCGDRSKGQRRALAYRHLGGLPIAETGYLIDGSVDAARRAAAEHLRTLRLTYRAREVLGRGVRR